ncbi:MAG: glycoside hydrolase family 20 zincin-like fold domain-containing protein [Chloroflexota bacterium]
MCLSTRLLLTIVFLIFSLIARTQDNFFLSPQPKQINVNQGTFKIGKAIKIYVSHDASTETRFACKELSTEIERIASVNVSNNLRKASILVGLANDPGIQKLISKSKLALKDQDRDEGYILEILPDKILCTAYSEAGLFYGIQTLKQLVRAYGNALPALTIIDWPSLKYRGWMDDISRGPIPTVDFLKLCIRKMSEYKQNYFTLYTEDVFKLRQYPDIAPADGLTQEEVADLTQYAAQYHIEIIGNLQSFGHMAKILANPFYSELGENSDILNPANESTYKFLKNMYAEVVPSYKSQFFNINCDETFGLGEGRSRQMASEIGVDGIYAYHINRIDQLIKPYNKRLMMWGDIAVNNPGIINKLPKDLVILSWGYHAAESFDDAILPFKKSGFDFMVAPGVSCWNEVWPGMQNAVVNISNYVRDGYKLGAMGMMNTAWDDNGHNLFNNNWHGLIWGAECSWNPLPADSQELAIAEREVRLAEFNKSFDKQFFHHEGITSVLLGIDSLRNLHVTGILNEWSFWSDITDFRGLDTTEEYTIKNKELLTKSEILAARLNKILKEAPENSEMIDNALLAIIRIQFTAEKNVLRQQLFKLNESRNKQGSDVYKTEYHQLIADAKSHLEILKTKLYEIKKEYVELWQRENRSWWLDKNLNDYNVLYTSLCDAGNKIFINLQPGNQNRFLIVTMASLFKEDPIVYTIDGTEPSANSPQYNDTIHVSNSCLIKARAITMGKPGPVSEKFITFHKAIGCLQKLNATYSNYNAAYAAGGDMGLLDGLKGTRSFRDGRWQGYQGQDLDLQIDLKERTAVHKVSVDFLQNSYSWILLPKDVEIFVSEDGINFKSVVQVNHEIPRMTNEIIIHNFNADLKNINTRYLRIIAHNPGPLPEAHHAAGNPSFIFADEIVVE